MSSIEYRLSPLEIQKWEALFNNENLFQQMMTKEILIYLLKKGEAVLLTVTDAEKIKGQVQRGEEIQIQGRFENLVQTNLDAVDYLEVTTSTSEMAVSQLGNTFENYLSALSKQEVRDWQVMIEFNGEVRVVTLNKLSEIIVGKLNKWGDSIENVRFAIIFPGTSLGWLSHQSITSSFKRIMTQNAVDVAFFPSDKKANATEWLTQKKD